MSIFITDSKTNAVRYYCTKKKQEKAIETLLNEIEDLVSGETHEGYTVDIVANDRTHSDCMHSIKNFVGAIEQLPDTVSKEKILELIDKYLDLY